MPQPFDPYHRWLGIPPSDQPPNHYRLLGLQLFEDDIEVIRDSAERQISHVRRYALGEHGADCQQLLNDLGKAKAALLVDAERAAYDRQLRRLNPRGFESPSLTDGPWRTRALAASGIAIIATAACVYLLQSGSHRSDEQLVSIANRHNALPSEGIQAPVETDVPVANQPDEAAAENPAVEPAVADASSNEAKAARREQKVSPVASSQNAIVEIGVAVPTVRDAMLQKRPASPPSPASPGGAGEVESIDSIAGSATETPPFLKHLVSLKAHVGKTRSVAPSPSGDVLASTGDDQQLRLWSVADRSSITVSHAATGPVDHVAFSPTEDLLAVWRTGDADENGVVTLWDIRERRVAHQFRGGGAASGVAFSPHGEFVSYLFGDGESSEVTFWAPWTDRDATSFLLTRAGDLTRRRYTGLTPHIGQRRKRRWNGAALMDAPNAEEEPVTFANAAAYCFSPTGRYLAASTESGEVMFADLVEQKLLGPLRADASGLTDLTFNGDESLIATTSTRDDESLLLWRVSNLDLAASLATELTDATAIAWSPVSSLFATGSSDGSIRLWDSTTARQVDETEANGHGITDIVFFPDGSQIAAGDTDGKLSLWRLEIADRAGPRSMPRTDELDQLAKSFELRDLQVSVSPGSRNVLCKYVLKSTLPDRTSVPRDPFDGSYVIGRCVCRVGKYHSTVRYFAPGPEIAPSRAFANSFTAFLREQDVARRSFTVEFQTRWGGALQTKTIEF